MLKNGHALIFFCKHLRILRNLRIFANEKSYVV